MAGRVYLAPNEYTRMKGRNTMKGTRSIDALEALDAPLADLGGMTARRHHAAALWGVMRRKLRKFFIPHH